MRLILPFVALILLSGASTSTAAAPSVPSTTVAAAPASKSEPPLAWHDVREWGVEGRAWEQWERKRWFDRLPGSAEGKVTEKVWNLSRHSAGMLVHFRTDSTTIWADYTLHNERLAGSNMTAIGASGLDLYARDASGQWRWAGVTRPAGVIVRQQIITGLAPGLRDYALYLPLFNGVETLSIGVAPDASFEGIAPRREKPIVFYGTSITHGASASRPGMCHPAILGRRLGRPVINLGFSGNGKMDAAIGELVADIDAAVFVVDCLPNMSADLVRERCIPLVQQIRSAHPDTPIVLVEDRRNANAWILPERDQHHTANRAALRECFEKLQAGGMGRLHYIAGDDLIGRDGEGTTDGSHPNDLGFVRQADVFEAQLRKALVESMAGERG